MLIHAADKIIKKVQQSEKYQPDYELEQPTLDFGGEQVELEATSLEAFQEEEEKDCLPAHTVTVHGHQEQTGSPYPHSQLASLVIQCVFLMRYFRTKAELYRDINHKERVMPHRSPEAIKQTELALKQALAIRGIAKERAPNNPGFACLWERLQETEGIFAI